MPGKGGRRLVIDADVARSAGETEHAVSSACRQFLDAVTKFRHRVVMAPEIQEEWREHASRYTHRWLGRMYARRLVDRPAVGRDDRLRLRVAAVLPSAGDLHLLEAAIATDRLVASRDERARAHFRRVSGKIREIQSIVWVNPTSENDAPIQWLSSGAATEANRQLGA